MKKLFFSGALCAAGLLLVLELFFRFVLPGSQWPRAVIAESGVRKFDSESFASGIYTYTRYSRGRYRWSVNNQGWNSIYPYEAASVRRGSMVAILGDSYLEGFYAHVDEHLDVKLKALFADEVDFYTFAMSGGILSQYIAIMEYEIEPLLPDAYVVFVNMADVAMSVRDLGGRHPYYFQYEIDQDGQYAVIEPVARSRSRLKDLALQSALVRYLRLNAQLAIFGGGLADANANEHAPGAEGPSPDAVRELEEAAAFLVSRLAAFGRPVLIVADCPRTWVYEGGKPEAFEDVVALRGVVESYATVSLLELAPYYEAEYQATGRRFSVPGNPHWDAYTYDFIASVIRPAVTRMLDHE